MKNKLHTRASDPAVKSMSNYESLLDYRRAVAAMYADVRRADGDPAKRWQQFRHCRDGLFRTHPQSALSAAQQASFTELAYYDYDLAWRMLLPVDTNVEPAVFEIALEHDGVVRIQRFGKLHFAVGTQTIDLSLFWIMGYGGGLFLPFRDATNNHETYGGGRYILDTIKHADLGHAGGYLVVDFNYAYNPSCAYNSRWSCPLAPVENNLSVPIPAGEQQFV